MTTPTPAFRAAFHAGAAWAQATTSRTDVETAVQQAWEQHGATTPGGDRGRELVAAQAISDELASMGLALSLGPDSHAVRRMASAAVRVLPAPVETEAGDDDGPTTWQRLLTTHGPCGCPVGDTEDGACPRSCALCRDLPDGWPCPAFGGYGPGALATTPPAPEGEAGCPWHGSTCDGTDHENHDPAMPLGERLAASPPAPGEGQGAPEGGWTFDDPCDPELCCEAGWACSRHEHLHNTTAPTCPTCATRPADLDTDQQQWRHHHCADGCPGHWVHDQDVTEQRCEVPS